MAAPSWGWTGPPSFLTQLSSPRLPSLDQLRAERLRREAAERARAEALLARARGVGPPEEQPGESELGERRRRYNSQFNPQWARRPAAGPPPAR